MSLRLLVLADAHYSTGGPNAFTPPQRRIELGRELVRRAIEDARRRGGFDVICLVGDMMNDHAAPTARADLLALRQEIAQGAPDVPLLAVPGNHDGDPGRLMSIFDQPAGMQEIGGYRFFAFCDAYGPGDVCTRPADQMEQFRLAAAESAGRGPLIVLQHNPMNPVIPSDSYPYMLTNRDEVMADYVHAGVLLSLSGHYHAGQEPSIADGVRYYTAESLCQPPYGYSVITLDGEHVSIEPRRLMLEGTLPLVDCHTHTELAYCAQDVSAEGNVSRAATFGLSAICIVEHAPQLYMTKDDFWAGRHVRDQAVWRQESISRARQYRELVGPLRQKNPNVYIGFEIEMDAAGEAILRDEDRRFADVLLGAVHFFCLPTEEMTDAEMIAEYVDATDRILDYGVDVLAHPWRLLDRKLKNPWPGRRDAYAYLAKRLAQTDTAAEINYHKTANDADFFALCVQHGVKIATGSDAHEQHETANLGVYLDLLRQIAPVRVLAEILWQPRRRME